MGTEIPHIKYDAKQNDLTYSFSTTHESVDIAREAFRGSERAYDQAGRGGKLGVPPGGKYQEDTEAGKCA